MAIANVAQTQLKEVFGNMTFTEALASQNRINTYIQQSFGDRFAQWGILVSISFVKLHCVALMSALDIDRTDGSLGYASKGRNVDCRCYEAPNDSRTQSPGWFHHCRSMCNVNIYIFAAITRYPWCVHLCGCCLLVIRPDASLCDLHYIYLLIHA